MFEIIAEPLNKEDVKVDLVFVHGISDGWRSTWNTDGQSEVSWIQDFIPRDIPHARIFACGRNVLDGPQKYRPFSTDGLQEYERNRNRYSEKRPVIFLAHSLGGLILQAFLQECTAPLRVSTKGIIFFGTPNLSRQENQRINLRAALASLGHAIDPDYLLNLGSISDRFSEWVVQQQFTRRMVCFYERLPVTGGIMVVEKESKFLPHCESQGLDANHINITKFQSSSSPNYQTVLQCLRSMYCLADESMRVLLRHSLQTNSYGRLVNLPSTPDGCEEFIASTQGSAAIRDDGRLALINEDQGHYEKAEERYQATINSLICKGRCSPEIAGLGQLAVALTKQSLGNEIEERFREAAQSLRTLDIPGSDDCAVLFCLYKWASLLCKRGRYKIAELCSKCCLEARIRISGKGSDPTLLTAATLTSCLVSQNRHQEAHSILRDSLENRNLPMSNPSPEISVLQILAKLVLEGGCEELAESLSSGVLRKSIHLHGMDHPFTLNCISSLAVVLAQRGHLSRAEALSRRALKGLEHALGNDHPDCLKTACRLADYICAQERYDDATLRHKTILKKQQMRIGKDHPDTLLTMRSLGIDFALQRSWRDSETLLDEAFDRLKVCCGPEDAQTIETADVLEYVKDMQEQKDHSRGGDNWQQDLLKIFRTRTRPMSYNTLIYANSDSSCHTSAEAELLQAVIAHDEERLAKALLENNFESAVLGRALRESAATSQEAMVRTLLSSNAPVNGQSGYHGSALQAASLAGSRAIVELLLENKADVYHEGGILGNALRAAVFGHNEAILRLLLQSIGPRKSSRDILNSSLQLALRNDDPAMIDLLLGAGADINAGDSFLGSPLQQAAFFGQENIMTRQLRSADINKRGGIFGIPLQAALETQNESVVKQLLEAGATVHSKSTNSEPKGQISTQEQEELAKIMLKRLAYSLPQRIHSVDFGLWDPMQAPKHSIIRVTRPVESHRYSRGHSPKPLPSEKPPQPKRVPTLKRLLKGGGTSEVSHANLPTRGPRARTQRSFQSVKRRVSGLK